jgi:hypothetical protein
MMRFALAALASALICSAALAQTYHDTAGTIVPGVVVIDPTDNSGPLFTSANPAKISGSFSATLSGFAPTPSYSQLSPSTTSSRVALPSGTVVVVYNTGSTDVFVTLGGSGVTATSADDVVKAGGWMAFAVGSNTYLAGITASGSTTLNISGGSGLPTGGGGGGGSGSVPTGSAGSPNASVVTVQGISGGSGLPVTATISGTPTIAGTVTANAGTNLNTSALALETGGNLAGINGKLTASGNGLKVDASATTQPVSAASLPLPSGAATAANQTNVQASAGSSSASALGVQGVSGGLAVPVTGTVTANNPVNVTETNCSGSIANADTAVTLIAASATIHGFRIANIDSGHSDEVAWFSTTTTAAASTAQSYPLPPPTPTTFAGFGSYTSPPGEGLNSNLSVVAHTVGHVISCTYW